MNSYPINSGAINAAVRFAAIVYLPSASATIELNLAERTSVVMTGSTSMGMDLTGDISKVSNLGTALTGISITSVGDLTQFRKAYFPASEIGLNIATSADLALNRRVYFGDTQASLAMDMSGLLQTVSQLPPASSGYSIAPTGAMNRLRLMNGATGFAMDVVGNPTNIVNFGKQVLTPSLSLSGAMIATRFLTGESQKLLAATGDLAQGLRVGLGDAASEVTIEASGALRKTARMVGGIAVSFAPTGSLSRGVRVPMVANTPVVFTTSGGMQQTHRLKGLLDSSFDPTGELVLIKRLEANEHMQFSLIGDLSNNAQSADLEKYLMIRQPINREMTR